MADLKRAREMAEGALRGLTLLDGKSTLRELTDPELKSVSSLFEMAAKALAPVRETAEVER